MTATLTSKLYWDVTWSISEPGNTGATDTARFTEFEHAAAMVRDLESWGEWAELTRVEVTTEDNAELGIAAGSEWIANPDPLFPGTLWERVAERADADMHRRGVMVARHHYDGPICPRATATADCPSNHTYRFSDSESEISLYTRDRMLDTNNRAYAFGRYQTLASGSIVAGLLVNTHIASRRAERRAFGSN